MQYSQRVYLYKNLSPAISGTGQLVRQKEKTPLLILPT